MDCPHHKVLHDPDPYDSFNSDDMAVVCGMTPNKTDVWATNLEQEFMNHIRNCKHN